ncbi:ABC transporter substrate-binding protein [Atopobiaceae bacterium 24-176]
MNLRSRMGAGAVVAGLALTLGLSACGTPADPATALGDGASVISKADAEASYKDVLNVGIAANPPTLDVHGVNSNIVDGIGMHIYESLFSLDENYNPTPVLAESYDVSEDGKTYTIKLREGVKFHNGKTMDADDVVASMNAWLARSSKAALLKGAEFSRVDDATVRLVVPEATGDIITQLAGPIQFAAIYPASVVESAGEEGVTEFVGTGPYRLSDWKQDQCVSLVRFEDYSQPEGDSSGLTGRKLAIADTLNFKVIPDETTRVAALQSGEIDVAEEVPLERYEELSGDDRIKLSVQNGGTMNLFLNTSEGPLANADLRQAVLASLNMDDIMLAAYGDESLYSLDPSWSALGDAQWDSKAGAELYNQNNEAKAKELMEKAGYNGQTLTIVATPDYADMYAASLVIQEQLRQAGFNVELEESDFATFMERRADPGQYDLFVTSNSYNPLPVQLSVLNPTWAGLDAPEVTEGVAKIRAAETPEQAKAAWDELQGFIYEHGAATVLGHYTGLYAVGADVDGFDYLRYPFYWNAGVRA